MIWREHRLTAVLVVVVLIASIPFAHSDLSSFSWVAHYFANGELNVYAAVLRDKPEVIGNVTYPPLTYWLIGAWMRLGHTIFNLFAWLDEPNGWMEFRWLKPKHVFWFRLLYLPFILMMPMFALRMLRALGVRLDKKRGFTAFVLFQPIALWTTFMFGQFDIIPAVLAFGGVALLLEGSLLSGIALLALGTMLKNFPIAFLLIACGLKLLFTQKREERGRILLGLAVFGAVAGLIYLLLAGDAFSRSFLAFNQHGRTLTKLVFGEMELEVGSKVYLLVAALMLFVTVPRFADHAHRLQLTAVLRRGLPAVTLNRVIFFLCVAAVSLIYADRFWWAQYLCWWVPWLSTFVVFYSIESKSERHFAAHLAFNAAFLLATLVLFRDQNHAIFRPEGVTPPGERLSMIPGWLPWSIISAYALVHVVLGLLHAFRAFVATEPAVLAPPHDGALARLGYVQAAMWIAFVGAYGALAWKLI